MVRFWRRRTVGEPVVRPEGDPGAAPDPVRADLRRAEQVLATAREDGAGHWLVLTTWRLLERAETGETVLERPWHEVDTGVWNPDAWSLTVDFVDRVGARQWQLQRRTGPGQVPAVFRERVNASVVLVREVDLGLRRQGRVSIRKVLQTRELVDQVLLGRGSRNDDEPLARALASARLDLREQAGLDPEPTV